MDAFKSTHVQAVSVSWFTRPSQFGGHQSAGQPDHAEGHIVGGGGPAGGSSATRTPCGSPGTAAGGPTVAGGTSAGSFGFGVTFVGGRIARCNHPGGIDPCYANFAG